MAPRKSIPIDVQTRVLSASRRRCCLCYFLNENHGERKGQIAHLNKNPADSRYENLVWLCLEHHDVFDGQTSQSKNYTEHEVRKYRDSLIRLFEPDNVAPNVTEGRPATGVVDEVRDRADSIKMKGDDCWTTLIQLPSTIGWNLGGDGSVHVIQAVFENFAATEAKALSLEVFLPPAAPEGAPLVLSAGPTKSRAAIRYETTPIMNQKDPGTRNVLHFPLLVPPTEAKEGMFALDLPSPFAAELLRNSANWEQSEIRFTFRELASDRSIVLRLGETFLPEIPEPPLSLARADCWPARLADVREAVESDLPSHILKGRVIARSVIGEVRVQRRGLVAEVVAYRDHGEHLKLKMLEIHQRDDLAVALVMLMGDVVDGLEGLFDPVQALIVSAATQGSSPCSALSERCVALRVALGRLHSRVNALRRAALS
jgi:hypothetical protein